MICAKRTVKMTGEVGYHKHHVEVVRGAQLQHEVTTSFGFLLGYPPQFPQGPVNMSELAGLFLSSFRRCMAGVLRQTSSVIPKRRIGPAVQ